MSQALPPWSAGKGERIGLRFWASNLKFGYRVSGLSKKHSQGTRDCAGAVSGIHSLYD